MANVDTNDKAKDQLLKLFKQRQKARVEKNGIIIGECYKTEGRWNWYIDSEA